MLILPSLVPVEQTPRIRFDPSLAYGAVGLGRVIRHFTLTDFSPHDSITRWMRLFSPVEFPRLERPPLVDAFIGDVERFLPTRLECARI